MANYSVLFILAPPRPRPPDIINLIWSAWAGSLFTRARGCPPQTAAIFLGRLPVFAFYFELTRNPRRFRGVFVPRAIISIGNFGGNSEPEPLNYNVSPIFVRQYNPTLPYPNYISTI